MQKGSLIRSSRRQGPDVWEYRWRESCSGQTRKHRRIVIGTLNTLKNESAALKSIAALRRDININDRRMGTKPLRLAEWESLLSSIRTVPTSVGFPSRQSPPRDRCSRTRPLCRHRQSPSRRAVLKGTSVDLRVVPFDDSSPGIRGGDSFGPRRVRQCHLGYLCRSYR
jgi:hypothetical protein